MSPSRQSGDLKFRRAVRGSLLGFRRTTITVSLRPKQSISCHYGIGRLEVIRHPTYSIVDKTELYRFMEYLTYLTSLCRPAAIDGEHHAGYESRIIRGQVSCRCRYVLRSAKRACQRLQVFQAPQDTGIGLGALAHGRGNERRRDHVDADTARRVVNGHC